MNPAEIERLMAESEDMIAFGASIGIAPDDDSEEAQKLLVAAWEHHCAKVMRNERGLLLVEDLFLRLKDEELKELLISSILLKGLERASGPLAVAIEKWLKGDR